MLSDLSVLTSVCLGKNADMMPRTWLIAAEKAVCYENKTGQNVHQTL